MIAEAGTRIVLEQANTNRTNRRRRFSRRSFLRGAATFVGAGLSAGAYAREVEPFWLDVHEMDIAIRGLPRAFDGLRVAHLTDLHTGPRVPIEYLRRAIQHVNDAAPDVVLLTGDVVHNSPQWIGPAAELLSALQAPVYVSFGNHDYSLFGSHPGKSTVVADPLQRALQRIGCVVLRNRASAIERDGQRIWIVGIEDLWSSMFDPAAAFAQVDRSRDAEAVCIAMSHNPDSVPHVLPFAPKLILSGHTHGGQVRVPLLGAPILPVRNRRFDQGLFELPNDCQLYVGRGVGFLKQVRFCCRPEIAVMRLAMES